MNKDFLIKNGNVIFTYREKKYSFSGTNLIGFLREKNLMRYFEYIVYQNIKRLFLVTMKGKVYTKLLDDKKWNEIAKIPIGLNLKIVHLKANIENPFSYASSLLFENFNMMKGYFRSIEATEEFYKKVNDKFGISKKLGDGGNGEAYLISNGNVLKITSDKSEIAVARNFLKKKNEHYVDIYNIWKVPAKFLEKGNERLFLIEAEYVTPIDEEEQEFANFISNFPDSFLEKGKINDLNEDDIRLAVGGKILSKYLHVLDNEMFYYFFDEYVEMIAAFNYSLTDLHGENLGRKKDGTLCAFDSQSLVDWLSPSKAKKIKTFKEAFETEKHVDDLESIKNEFNVTKTLGKGEMGIAFETSDGKILKITKDESEYNFSVEAQKHNFKHYVKIYSLKELNFKGKKRSFLILKDKVNLLSEEEKNLNDACQVIEQVYYEYGETIEDVIKDYNNDNLNLYEIEEAFKNKDAFLKYFEEFREMIDEIRKVIVFSDYHSDNVGRKNDGTLCGFDFRQNKNNI